MNIFQEESFMLRLWAGDLPGWIQVIMICCWLRLILSAPSRKDRAYPSSWVAINPQGNQPILKASRLRIGTWSSHGEALTLEDSSLKWDSRSGILMRYEEGPWDQPRSSSAEALQAEWATGAPR